MILYIPVFKLQETGRTQEIRSTISKMSASFTPQSKWFWRKIVPVQKSSVWMDGPISGYSCFDTKWLSALVQLHEQT